MPKKASESLGKAVTVTMGSHLVPFCGIIVRICTSSVLHQCNLGNVHVWNQVSGTQSVLLWIMMQVVSNLYLWTHIQVGLSLLGDENSQLTNGGEAIQGRGKERKKIQRFLEKSLDESCFSGLCNCPVWIILYSLVPTSLLQLCLLHHCFTQMLSEVTEIIRTSTLSFLIENWMLRLVFLVASVKSWLA